MHGLYTGCKTPLSVAGGEGRPCACERVCNGAKFVSFLPHGPGARCAGSDELTEPRSPAPQPALRACVASRHAVGRRACHRSQCTDGPTTRECQSQRIANTYTDVRSPPQSARRVTARPGRRSRARSRCRAHLSRSRRHALNDGRCGRGWALGGSGERRAACARRSLVA